MDEKTKQREIERDPYLNRTWVLCPDCEEMWCAKHQKHVFDCDCPPIEEWISEP